MTVEVISSADAEARRAEIVEQVGGDEEAFRARAAVYALDDSELALFDELRALDYLLGR